MKYIAGILALAMSAGVMSAQTTTVNGELSSRFNKAQVQLISLSAGDTLATTNASDGIFSVILDATQPQLVQVRAGGRAVGNLVLEPGTVVFTQEGVTGTPLNNALTEYTRKYSDTYAELSELSRQNPIPEEEIQSILEGLNNYSNEVMMANIDNPVGASILLDISYEMSLPELENLVAAHPSLSQYKKIDQIIHHKRIAAETGEGKKYKDFAVEYDGKTTKLSDLIKPGRYTLVDFWASWCGPCRREMPVIKEILNEYGPQGLDVVGVAVWDQAEDTKKAMQELDITWPVIIDAKTIPTDLYGILGIPSIILIAPDGTILSRDKQDEDLKADVAAAFAKK